MTSVGLQGKGTWASVVAVAAVVGYVCAFVVAADRLSYDTWGAFVVGPILLVATLPLVVRLSRRELDPRIARLLPWAFGVKIVMALARAGVALILYHGVADAALYSDHGAAMAMAWRHGQWLGSPSQFPGTGFIDGLTAAVYFVTGRTLVGAYFVFAWIGFWGSYFFYRALVTALPDVDHHRYALLMFFLPSFLYWPSAVGKDAWMFAAVGLAVLGASRIYVRRRGGWTLLAIGLGATALVRPHITAMVFAAVAAGFLVRPNGPRATILAPIGKAFGVVILVIGGLVLLQHLKRFLNVDTLDTQTIDQTLSTIAKNTGEGGSAFSPTPVVFTRPQTWGTAAFNLFVRPLPFEAHNVEVLMAALEGSFVALLFVTGWRRVSAALRRIREPFLVMSVVYLVIFVFAFSSFGNFGITTRERVQALPFLLALVSFRPAAKRVADRHSPSSQPQPHLLGAR